MGAGQDGESGVPRPHVRYLKQIRKLLGEGVARIVCPEDIFLDPCKTGTARRVVVDGLPTIEDEARGISQTVLPR